MVKLHKQPNDNSICVQDMQDGQVAIITQWPINPIHTGLIVQRYKDMLITIGADSGKSFPRMFEERAESYRVRVLQKGELIEIC